MELLDFDIAQERLATHVARPTTHETIALAKLHGRILAEDIIARIDMPAADHSAMDGYAIRSLDAKTPGVSLPVQQRCYAGQLPDPLLPGQAIRIFTGSLIPAGADTVIMQEDCTENDDMVSLHVAAKSGHYIRRRGEDMHAGDVVLQKGCVLRAGAIAVLAAQGIAQAQVFPQPRIGILTTGDELTEPGQELPPAAIYNSNAPMVASLCQGMGLHDLVLRHAPDDAAATEKALRELADQCDLVLSIGGISVGEKDLVKPAIEALSGTLDLWRVRMKPGKPVALARLQGKPVVCLPGNPGSAFVVFTLLVSPLIRTLQGRTQSLPAVQQGLLDSDHAWQGTRDEFLRVQVHYDKGGLPRLVPHAQQGSGALANLAWAQGLARIPAGARVEPYSELGWYALCDWLS